MFARIKTMKIAENKKTINKAKLIYVSSIIFGIIAHGMMLFNQYSFHDNAHAYNSVGPYYVSGRWMLWIIKILTSKITGNLYSLPLINGLITILCIASIAFIISLMLRIESNVLNVALSAILVTSPAVTGTMGYMYQAPYYFFGTLLGVIGVYIFTSKEGIIAFLISTILMACSVGVYQANICVCISVLLILMLDKILETDFAWKEYWELVAKNVVVCIAFVVEYIIANEIIIRMKRAQFTDYKSINSYGRTSFENYLSRILTAYKEFFNPTHISSIFVLNTKWFHWLLILAGISLVIVLLRGVYKKSKRQCTQLVLPILGIPLVTHFIFVMVEEDYISSLMTFAEEISFVFLIWLIGRVFVKSKVIEYIKKVSVLLIFVIVVLSAKYSNICYAKANLIQSQAVSYFTTLVTKIKSCEGYDDELPVVYLNEREKEDLSFAGTSYLIHDTSSPPYWSSTINDYAWKDVMKQQCGFSPIEGDATIYEGNTYVEAMPSYPDDGSIQIVDGQVVVKF